MLHMQNNEKVVVQWLNNLDQAVERENSLVDKLLTAKLMIFILIVFRGFA
jgi:hypothetical protein